jgi:hypothetical protein
MKGISLAVLGLLVGLPTLAQTPSPAQRPIQERTSPSAAPPRELPKPSPGETVRCEDHPTSDLNDVARSACEDQQKKK